MTDGVIIRISLTALLRRQPERSEVSLYIICIMADRVSLYFIGDCPRSYLGESSKTAPQMRRLFSKANFIRKITVNPNK